MSSKGSDRIRSLRAHRPFCLLLVLYISTVLWLSFRLPAFSAPNEVFHYEYVALIRRTGSLPNPATSQRMDERHQPPLYYTVATAFSLPFPTPPLDSELVRNLHPYGTVEGNRNEFLHTTPATVPVLYIGRLVTMLFGVAAIVSMYAAARQSLPDETSLLVVSIMAFQPMFLFLSGAMGNDLAVTATAAILLAYTSFVIVRNWNELAYFVWGVLFACAMLTKASSVFLGLLLPIACLAKWQATRRAGAAARCGVLGIVGFSPIYAAWLLVNQARELDALAIEASLPLKRVLALPPGDYRLLGPYLFRLWRSFWLDWSVGETGYTSDWIYMVAGIVLVIFLAGGLRRTGRTPQDRLLTGMHLLWIIPLLALFMGIKALMVKEVGFLVPEGRWVLPAWPSIAWLAGSGWSHWWPAGKRARASKYAVLIPPATTLALLFLTIPRLNPQAHRLAGIHSIPESVAEVGLVYDEQIALLAIQSGEFVVDQPAEMDLYWQAVTDIDTDYLVSAQLVVPSSEGWEVVERRHSYHGNGLSPSKGWRRGDVYQDRLVLVPRAQLNGPTQAFVLINLLVDETGIKVPTQQEGHPVETAVAQWVVLRPAVELITDAQSMLQNPVTYGGLLQLTGFSLERSSGGPLVTLWWKALSSIDTDYTVFAHLLDETGEMVAQSDSMPNRGQSPTSIWRPGDVIRDEHQLPLDRAPSAGILLIGVYNLDTLLRLPASQDGRPLAEHVFRHPIP
jgi:hypothetical protein